MAKSGEWGILLLGSRLLCRIAGGIPNLLGSIAREGLAIMAGLFWDLGTQGADVLEQACAQSPTYA